ncbi:MAG: hypothetical protein ACI4OM_03020, partial [Evtepia sp.]
PPPVPDTQGRFVKSPCFQGFFRIFGGRKFTKRQSRRSAFFLPFALLSLYNEKHRIFSPGGKDARRPKKETAL